MAKTTKPALILSLEKAYDISLTELEKGEEIMTWGNKNKFLLNDKGEIIGLNLWDSEITDVSHIKELKQLTKLQLNENEINDISPIKELKQLTVLYLGKNQITDISHIKELKQLTQLNLGNNQITDISHIKELRQLTKLYLYKNEITDISHIKELTQLTQLYLYNNEITDISHIKELKQLTILDLNNNQIEDISHIKELKQLTKLNLSNNQVSDLSPLIELIETSISLTLNRHDEVEDEFEINVDNNPLSNPPKEIVEQGKEAVLRYFIETDKYGEQPLYEAKLLIVGEPDAGKTSLLNKLIDPSYEIIERKLNETIGVYVHNGYTFPYYKNKSINLTTHIWDFGGQEKQYPLHQYFLKDKSVYALLSLDRADNQYLDKWFSIIRLLSGNENEIMLVLNQKNRTSQSSNFNKEKYERQGFKFKEHILDMSKDEERFNELRTNIENALASLPHIGGMYPKYCKTIADSIDKARFENKKDYLTYEEYERLCADLKLTKDEVPKKALEYLSIIGKVIHYNDDCNLERIIIINPHWLIDAIYGILTCEQLDEFHQKGRFTKEWMIEYLKKSTPNKPQGYKESESLHILNLMLKNHFDICYSVSNNYLIPLCMPEALPDHTFDESSCIQLLFKYEIMPSGMVARVLVRLSNLIEGDLISRTAGILNNQNNRAKIEEYYLANDANRYIRIMVSGELKTRKQFLEIIKNELIKVQKDWFENLEVNEIIPCNCSLCRSTNNAFHFEMKKLQNYINKNKFHIDCGKSIEEVNIFELLGEVYELGLTKKITSLYDITSILKVQTNDNLIQFLKEHIDTRSFFKISNFGDYLDKKRKPQNQNTIKIFLASSNEMKEEREKFRLYIASQNDHLHTKGIYLKVVNWENYLDEINIHGKQNQLNEDIKDCQIVLCLFFTKVGQFTEEEFDTAYKAFQSNNKLKIYTYFKNAHIKTGEIKRDEINSLLDFKDKLKGLGHFIFDFENSAELHNKFKDQLEHYIDL